VAATWVNQGSLNGPREISSRVRFVVWCLQTDSHTLMYRHVAVWTDPAESRANSDIGFAVTVGIPRSAGLIDLDPDSESDDAT